MAKNFSLFLALRYLKPKRTFVSVITLISVFGVTLGVTILLLVISVMTGFEHEIKEKILGFEPHILVVGDRALDFWPDLVARLREIPSVGECTPYVQGQVILEFDAGEGTRRLAPKIRAIEPDEGPQFERMKELVVEGEFDLSGDTAVVGLALAEGLGIRQGDVITVYSPKNMDELLDAIGRVEERERAGEDTGAAIEELKSMILPIELEVSGIFDSGRYDFNGEFIFVPLHIGQELYSLGPAVHGLAVQTSDPYSAHETKSAILELGESGYETFTWMDINRPMFSAVDMERRMMFFLLFFIIIVAAFCIMNTMITVTVQKRREIGLLKALGAQIRQIVWVFLGQGMIVGFAGTVTGIIAGLILVRYRNAVLNWLAGTFNISIFPADVYLLNELPAIVVPNDVLIISIGAFVICSLAALVPAYAAARLDPARALRNDQ